MNLSTQLEELLSVEAFAFCRNVSSFGAEEGVSVWLTGGLVRDLFLGRSSKDLDISVSSMGVGFAEKLSRRYNIDVTAKFERYGCVALRLEDGSRCDIVPLRKEHYPAPAAPPEITFIDSIEEDLLRRDFSLNAMALSLQNSDFGELYDFYGGHEDLKTQTLRILHDQSFMDDPVRIFRGIRFAVRMNLALALETKDVLFDSYNKGAMKALPNKVFLREFESTFSSANISSLFKVLNEWELLKQMEWPGFSSGSPDSIVVKIDLIHGIIKSFLRNGKSIRTRKCSWLSVLAVIVLVPPKAHNYFLRRFTPPGHIVAYLDEVKKLYIEMKTGLSSGIEALREVLKRPRKTEILVGAIAVASNSKDDEMHFHEALNML